MATDAQLDIQLQEESTTEQNQDETTQKTELRTSKRKRTATIKQDPPPPARASSRTKKAKQTNENENENGNENNQVGEIVEKEQKDSNENETENVQEQEDSKGKGKGKGKGKAKQPAKAKVEAVVEETIILPTTMPTSYNYEPTKNGHIKIVSWNVDGLRSAITKGFSTYLESEDADIICLQETKMQETGITKGLLAKYPYEYWSSSIAKKGYAGTAILSKKEPLNVTMGLGILEHDQEGRTITAEYPTFYLINCYVPNSGQKLDRLEYRGKWDEAMRNYLKTLDQKKPIIFTGDLNVAHTEIDLARPKTNKKTAGFTQQERDAFTELLACGFVDCFRTLNPGKTNQYSFWGTKFNAREKNIGWRLDYFVISERFQNSHVVDSLIRPEVWGASDHVPIILLLKDSE